VHSLRAFALIIFIIVALGYLTTRFIPPAYAQLATHLLINEAEMDPPGTDLGRQWVELYNPTNTTVNLSGWRLQSAGGSSTLLRSASLVDAGGYFVITLPGISLLRRGDTLTLTNSEGTVLDSTPRLTDTSDDNRTWQRFPNGIDTGSIIDWRFSPPTKGGSNGKFASQIMLTASPTSVTYGQSITFAGELNATTSTSITLTIRSSTSTANVTIPTSQSGAFTYSWEPNLAGSYSAAAFWKGDGFHYPASSASRAILVEKVVTQLNLRPSSLNLTDFTPTVFTGAISPTMAGIPVVIKIKHPNGTLQTQAVSTFDNGTFTFVLLPMTDGTWMVTASWQGDANHYGDDSASSTVVVTPAPRLSSLSLLVLELITIPVTLAVGFAVYKYGRVPLRLPLGQILKRRAPPHLRPLRVLNGAICPLCFRPMMYEPKGADWHCEHCGVYYET